MARTYTGLSGHYGAFELKAKYQRNMFLGTLFSVLFCAAIITGALLYQHLTAADMIIVQIDDDKGGEGQVTILPPPVNNPIKTKYEWASLRTSDLKIGIPVARPDEEFVEIEAVLPTRIEIEEHVDLAAGPAIEEYDGGFEFDKADDGYIPPPDSFISVEIPAQMIYAHEPEYPRLAKHAGIEAIVWVNALVDKEGKVREVMILRSSDSKAGFDQAAIAAAKKCKFKPAVQNGCPLAVWVSFSFEFSLSE